MADVGGELTPLTRVPGFSGALRARLDDYWITTAEEFASTARLGNGRHGDGLTALGVALGLDLPRMQALYTACEQASPRAHEYAALTELDVGDGLLLDDLPTDKGLDFAPAVELPPQALIPNLPPVRDQGRRNTCVAFTLATMLQILTGDHRRLSEQFLFWGAKQLDGRPAHAGGTVPSAAVAALDRYGVCMHDEWPYSPEPGSGSVGQGPPPAQALEAALARRATGGPLESNRSPAVRAALAEGRPVLLGLPVYPFWRDSGQARHAGRVRRPLDGEAVVGGHAVCAVGYRDDPAVPGGGFIIFRNSWGEAWGDESPDGAGTGYVPYAVVDRENRAAFALDAVPLDAPAAPGAAAAGGLIAEARAGLARAQAELERLAALLARIEAGER